ncbi:capsule biosynthesis protein [Cochlodiniinecator piscidefendens]|uniref:capsule biosynthesis protein n=1 Tax=Cochlodiniinecator piscidefendens TaxID=2715756 RepID=UPI0014086F54|nr:capsule biosynthesis protein [Cochlodiniinecator piscidefendens]
MTTKPKARKYRIRRGNTAGTEQQPTESAVNTTAPGTPAPARDGQVSSASEVSVEEQLADIRREGLTGRQLRMARRVAQRNGLAATSDYDAIRLLREKGIDPFKRSNMLELVVAGEDNALTQNLPQTVDKTATPQVPSTEVRAENNRLQEIQRIQLDIAKRRRRKLVLLLARLAFFVFLPTALAGYYYYNIASPLYATVSKFQIQKADNTGTGAGSLLGGSSLANITESISVQAFLQNRSALVRLDQEAGFIEHFSGDNIDPLQQLEQDSSLEDAYSLYSKYVLISFDPTEGIIGMEVSAATPEASEEFSRVLISLAEEHVDSMSQRVRTDQMSGARESAEEAEQKLEDAQRHVVALQEQYNVISSDTTVGLITGQISALQSRLTEERLSLAELEANTNPNQARINPMRGRISNLETMIAEEQSKLTETYREGRSLAGITGELEIARSQVEIRMALVGQAAQSLDIARTEAERQALYLVESVSPVPPDEPTYPRSFENTILAFLIFSGIYLMLSLTLSILREQVSS